MIKIITSFRHLLSSWLRYAISWLESFEHPDKEQSKFVDLAPTDEADKTGVYSEAILYATNNTKVSNIALTGPYGSGKSSIIQSFLKKYRRPALQISLASFTPEVDSNRQEIERSILQQILYGADANTQLHGNIGFLVIDGWYQVESLGLPLDSIRSILRYSIRILKKYSWLNQYQRP